MASVAPMVLLASLSGAAGDRHDAVEIDGARLSRADLVGAAGAVAARIGGAGVAAVDATPTLETVVGVVAGLLAGVVVVPVAPDTGRLERSHVLEDCAAAVMLGGADATGADMVESIRVDVTERRDVAFAEVDGAAPAMILYTSGTTGLPKGVPISRDALAADLDALADAWTWTAEDRLVHGLPLFHVHGLVLGVLGALRVGSPLVHTGRPTPAAYAAACGTLYFGVPTVWSRVAADRSAAEALRSARLLVSGSAALPAPVFERIHQLTGQAPVERYGMTETLITTSIRADGERRPGWVGGALAGIQTRVVAEGEGFAPADGETIGELEVRGPTVLSGYLNRPEADAVVFTPDGWFRTGDVACIGPDGYHRLIGRKATDLIKSGGYRIGAGEVEAALLAHPAVREAAVVGVPDDDLGQAVVAYVVAAGVQERDLIDFVAATLSGHKRPRRVELVDELPRNALGKVQKGLLVKGG